MNRFKKLYCRIFQACFKFALPFLPYRTPKIINSVKGIPEIKQEDIPKMVHYADKEANPLYPVPILMNAQELEQFYELLMEKEEENEII